jgi:hypothetical protein
MNSCKFTEIDIDFNFKSDTPLGKDPDSFSPTLRKYHKFLWSKLLPSGNLFLLDETPPHYLHHKSGIGEYFLSSDSVIPTFTRYKRLSSIIDRIPQNESDAFYNLSYTIGGMMIFPSNRINGKTTINGARGFNPKIRDRFDLTMECIRRYYCNENSPLTDTIALYCDYFELFENFQGYVDYFLLQDLVTKDYSKVKFFTPFNDFVSFIIPATIEDYQSYKQLSIDFIKARNNRIKIFCEAKTE